MDASKTCGFSFHDTYDVFKDIVDGYDGWAFCQIQYNYLDIEYPGRDEGPAVRSEQGPGCGGDGAAAVRLLAGNAGFRQGKGVPESGAGVVGLSPRHGGSLRNGRSSGSGQPEVSVVLSGMSTRPSSTKTWQARTGRASGR